MNGAEIRTVSADGFRVWYLDTGTDWPGLFRAFAARARDGGGVGWELLQEVDANERRRTWRVPLPGEMGGGT